MIYSVQIISHGFPIIENSNKDIIAKGRGKGQFRDGKLLKNKSSSIANILKMILPYKEVRINFIYLFENPTTSLFNFSCSILYYYL